MTNLVRLADSPIGKKTLEKYIFNSGSYSENSIVKYNASLELPCLPNKDTDEETPQGTEKAVLNKLRYMLAAKQATKHEVDLERECRCKQASCLEVKQPTSLLEMVANEFTNGRLAENGYSISGVDLCFEVNQYGQRHAEIYFRSPWYPDQKLSINIHIRLKPTEVESIDLAIQTSKKMSDLLSDTLREGLSKLDQNLELISSLSGGMSSGELQQLGFCRIPPKGSRFASAARHVPQACSSQGNAMPSRVSQQRVETSQLSQFGLYQMPQRMPSYASAVKQSVAPQADLSQGCAVSGSTNKQKLLHDKAPSVSSEQNVVSALSFFSQQRGQGVSKKVVSKDGARAVDQVVRKIR